MGAKIAGLIAFLLCALPFLIVSYFDRNSKTPINFWAGDTSLADKVTDVKAYNAEMAKIYGRCSAAFAVNGVCCLVSVAAAMILMSAVYRAYKKILDKYSNMDEEV